MPPGDWSPPLCQHYPSLEPAQRPICGASHPGHARPSGDVDQPLFRRPLRRHHPRSGIEMAHRAPGERALGVAIPGRQRSAFIRPAAVYLLCCIDTASTLFTVWWSVQRFTENECWHQRVAFRTTNGTAAAAARRITRRHVLHRSVRTDGPNANAIILLAALSCARHAHAPTAKHRQRGDVRLWRKPTSRSLAQLPHGREWRSRSRSRSSTTAAGPLPAAAVGQWSQQDRE